MINKDRLMCAVESANPEMNNTRCYFRPVIARNRNIGWQGG
jgi:hypothetical protein